MLNIYSDIGYLVNKLNEEQRSRFILFLESLKKDGLNVIIEDHLRSDTTIDDIIEDINNTTDYEKRLILREEAMQNGITTIPKEEWGVHEGHCCSKHGCKYGYIDCPVQNKLVEQKYPCEYCNENWI